MPKQEIIELQTRRTLRWNGKNDAIINFRKCNYSLNSFNLFYFKVSHYLSVGPFDLLWLSGFIVMTEASSKKPIVWRKKCVGLQLGTGVIATATATATSTSTVTATVTATTAVVPCVFSIIYV